jgi:hypothetical protein
MHSRRHPAGGQHTCALTTSTNTQAAACSTSPPRTVPMPNLLHGSLQPKYFSTSPLYQPSRYSFPPSHFRGSPPVTMFHPTFLLALWGASLSTNSALVGQSGTPIVRETKAPQGGNVSTAIQGMTPPNDNKQALDGGISQQVTARTNSPASPQAPQSRRTRPAALAHATGGPPAARQPSKSCSSRPASPPCSRLPPPAARMRSQVRWRMP